MQLFDLISKQPQKPYQIEFAAVILTQHPATSQRTVDITSSYLIEPIIMKNTTEIPNKKMHDSHSNQEYFAF